MDLQREMLIEDSSNDDDCPLSVDQRRSEIREITHRPRIEHPSDVSEAIDEILLELQKLFEVLQMYMNERHSLLMSLSFELTSLRERRDNLRKIVNAATFNFPLLKTQFVTSKGKSNQSNLDASEKIVNVYERLLGLLKMPIGAHIRMINDLKKFEQIASLVPGLEAMALIIARADQLISLSQAYFDGVNKGKVLAELKKKGVVVPLQGFRNCTRRVNNLQQVWNDAYIRSVIAEHEPECRKSVQEGMPVWEMFHAWYEPWEEPRK